jgi:hypothetical protein
MKKILSVVSWKGQIESLHLPGWTKKNYATNGDTNTRIKTVSPTTERLMPMG